MKITLFFFILLFAFSNLLFSDSWHNSLLPKGKSVAINLENINIVVPIDANAKERKAGEDLAEFLKIIYGKDFLVINDTEFKNGNYISVGNTALLRNARYESVISSLEPEGYAIQSKNGNLFIFGGERRGPLYGVYSLLEEDLGVRFWTKKKDYSIPKSKNLTLSCVPRFYNPPFEIRHPGCEEAFDSEFALYNKCNPFSVISNTPGGHYMEIPEELGGNTKNTWNCHTSFNFVNPNEYFEIHPEYFGEVGGKRTIGQLCWSNSEVIDIISNKLIDLIGKTGSNVIAVSPQDGCPLCGCAKCQELDEKEGSKSATILKALNEIIIRVNKVYPNAKFLLLHIWIM